MTTSAAPRSITIDQVVIASNQPDEQVLEALQRRMGSEEGWRETDQRIHARAAAQAPWEQAAETLERQLGTSDFTLFKTVEHTAEHTALHRLAGKTSRAIQHMAAWPCMLQQIR
jgi:regulator of protease activity HflC (stomatin/prohibitin superfamily)